MSLMKGKVLMSQKQISRYVVVQRSLEGADIFLDGLGRQSEALSVFHWAHRTQLCIDILPTDKSGGF